MFIKKRIPRHSVDGPPDKGRVRQAAGWLLCAVFFLIPLGYMLLSLGIFDFLTRNSYANLLDWYGRAFPTAFDRHTVSIQSFTSDWHMWEVRHLAAGNVVLAAMPVVYLAFSRSIWRFFRRLVSELGRGLNFLARGLMGCSPLEKGGFFLLMTGVLVYRLYFYFANPLQTDELCSYLYFVRPGFFISITSYPIPNNHVLYNGCCALLDLIPGLSIKAVMRLPSIAGDFFLLYSVFCLVRRWDGYGRAMVSVAGVGFCYLLSYYAVQGRGYQWQEVCALVTAAGCWECFCGPGRGRRRGYALFIAGAVAGLYINPVFMYHLTALGLACLWYCWRKKDRAGIFFLGRCGGIMAGWLAILYMPLILCSSWSALVANYFVTGTTYASLFAHVRDLAYIVKDITYYDVPGLCFMLMSAAGLYVAYRKGMIRGMFYDNMLLYLIALVISLAFWILYKRVYPVERNLCYLGLVINLVFINGCYDLFRLWFVQRPYVPLVVLLLLKIGGSIRGMYWDRWNFEHQPDVQVIRGVEKDIKELDELHPTSWQIMTSDDFYPMYAQEYVIRKGTGQRVIFSRTEAAGDVIFVPDSLKMPMFLDDVNKRYVLWADDKLTSYGKGMRIYILGSFVQKRGQF